MKLIIDIDEDYIKTTDGKDVTYYNASVLDNIRAEIEQHNRKPSHYPVDMISIETVLQIIDKHIAESGDKQ